ncbi:MAG: hypothetical protein ACKVOP_07345 [Sphingomonadaceae bacterium]
MIAALMLALAAQGASAPVAAERTIVVDARAAARLTQNTGLTVQWLGWERRGTVSARFDNGVLTLKGRQLSPEDKGSLHLIGVVTRIEKDRFFFKGQIDIRDTPDAGRECLRDGEYEFRITGKRRYWRLQEMEVCDGLTDYVDIYF